MDKKVLTHDIRKGMFVSALDRPWVDTPFMLQGFLVEDDEDVTRLQKYCRYVYVDLARSIGEAYQLEHAVGRKVANATGPRVVTAVRQQWQLDLDEPAKQNRPARSTGKTRPTEIVRDAPTARPTSVRLRTGARATNAPLQWTAEISAEEQALLVDESESATANPAPRARAKRSGDVESSGFGIGWFRSVAGSMAESVSDWMRRPDPVALPDVPLRAPLLDRMAPAIIVYNETESLAEELPRAKEVLERSHDVLSRIVAEVQSNGVVHLEKAAEVVNELVDSMERNPNALIWLSRLKDVDRRTYSHSLQSAIYMVAIGLHLGLARDELTNLSVAGMMLDVGKLRVPQALLEKPGKLTESEFEEVRAHVGHSLDILNESRSVHPKIAEAVARHHEREDGSGYPKGLKGESIGLYGRMAGLVDTFVALTNARPYASTLSMHEALRQLYAWRGGQFHEPLVEQFVQAVGVFPVGSMVELQFGRGSRRDCAQSGPAVEAESPAAHRPGQDAATPAGTARSAVCARRLEQRGTHDRARARRGRVRH